MTYAAHTEWKTAKEVEAFDRALADDASAGKSRGTKELFSLFGVRPQRPEAAS